MHKAIKSDQIKIICKIAKCSEAELPNLSTLYAGSKSGITDAGLKHVPNLTTLYAFCT